MSWSLYEDLPPPTTGSTTISALTSSTVPAKTSASPTSASVQSSSSSENTSSNSPTITNEKKPVVISGILLFSPSSECSSPLYAQYFKLKVMDLSNILQNGQLERNCCLPRSKERKLLVSYPWREKIREINEQYLTNGTKAAAQSSAPSTSAQTSASSTSSSTSNSNASNASGITSTVPALKPRSLKSKQSAPPTTKPTVKPKATPTVTETVIISESDDSHRSDTLLASSLGEKVLDAYDPAKPNDYEEYLEEKSQLLREKLAPKKNEFQPPPLYSDEISDERLSKDEESEQQRKKKVKLESGTSGGISNPAVAKMMAKMGYKEGQGLGKSGDGMKQALFTKKTDRNSNSGIIINLEKRKKKTQTPTCVILLTNMVGPGEVDSELQGEIEEECKKFGTVIRCVIYQERDPMCPPDEVVRIYVKFGTVEQAVKAKQALHGRFFGGRSVVGTYYDELAFDNADFGYEIE